MDGIGSYIMSLVAGTDDTKVIKFEYKNKKFAPPDDFETIDEHSALQFCQQYKSESPASAVLEVKAGVIDKLIKKQTLPASTPLKPAPAPPLPPIVESEYNSLQGDSANGQGAPMTPTGGAVLVDETENQDSSGGIPTEEPTRPELGEAHPTKSSEQPQIQTTVLDPIDLFNGAFYLELIDLEIPNTVLPFQFIRNYRSGPSSFGPFGWNWDHNYNLFVRELNTGDIALWRNLHEDILS